METGATSATGNKYIWAKETWDYKKYHKKVIIFEYKKLGAAKITTGDKYIKMQRINYIFSSLTTFYCMYLSKTTCSESGNFRSSYTN